MTPYIFGNSLKILNENKKDFALKNAIITVSVGIFSISTLVNMILANINNKYIKFIVNWKKKLQKISLKDMNEWIKWRKNKYSLQWWWNYYFILLPLIYSREYTFRLILYNFSIFLMLLRFLLTNCRQCTCLQKVNDSRQKYIHVWPDFIHFYLLFGWMLHVWYKQLVVMYEKCDS